MEHVVNVVKATRIRCQHFTQDKNTFSRGIDEKGGEQRCISVTFDGADFKTDFYF